MNARFRPLVGFVALVAVLVVVGCSLMEDSTAPPKPSTTTSVSPLATESTDPKHPLPGTARLHPDNRTAIAYECYYALREDWWNVSWVWSMHGQVHRSLWAYLLSDPNAHGRIMQWYGVDASLWKNYPSYYSNMNVYSWTHLARNGSNTGVTRSHGGQCRGFASLVVFRAGVRNDRLPSYGQNPAGYRPYSQIRIGDVIETTWANGHTAIVVGVVEGNVGSSVRKVVVVDSNFIGDEEIGMHVLAVGGSGVHNLANYRALNLGY